MLNCIDKYNWIGIVCNVLFFMIVQTGFFYYIASNQYQNVLESKLKLLKLLKEKNKSVEKKINEFKSDSQNLKIVAEEQKISRKKTNIELTKNFCGKSIGAGLILLSFVLLLTNSQRPWGHSDTINLLLIVFGYTTEILFFFFIVRKYQFVGDQYMISDLLEYSNIGNLEF